MSSQPEQVLGQEEFDLHQEVILLLPLTGREPFELRLPKFSGDLSCVKCGQESPRTLYHVGAASYLPCWSHWLTIPWDSIGNPVAEMPEHLDRTCSHCHYQWAEAVWDGTSPTKKSQREGNSE